MRLWPFFKKRAERRGFTFIEILLSIVVMGIIAGVTVRVLAVGLDIYTLIVRRNNAFQTARIALDRMVDEITFVGPRNINYMFENKFGFVDRNGQSTDFNASTCSHLGQSKPCIKRGDDLLAENAPVFYFQYYSVDGQPAFSPWDLLRISIDLIVDAEGNAGGVHLRTDIYLRSAFMYGNFN